MVTLVLGVFGGSIAPGLAEWSWRQVATAHAPSARISTVGVYDTNRHVFVLFGGQEAYASGNHVNDTWEYDGTDWHRMQPAHAPTPRRSHAMAYDAHRGVVVLFGGWDPNVGRSGETWEYDGNDWRVVSTATTPPPNWQQMMAWDARRGVVVMFGGFEFGLTSNSTWEYDGANWKFIATAHAPSGRKGATMSWDSVRQRMVLFGGSNDGSGSSALDDVWEYDGVDWSPTAPPTGPTAREAHGSSYHAAQRGTIVFGGAGAGNPPSTYFDDTWLLRDGNWTRLTTPATPPRRDLFAMDYDSARNVTVIFGGRGDGTRSLNDTWELSTTAVCGNGILESGEECDDGNTVSGDGCSSTCTLESPVPVCGNGIVEGGEECDDGNTISGDGCSASCTIEPPPAVCGNGILEPGEQCDDGNLEAGDGCSAHCLFESDGLWTRISTDHSPPARVSPDAAFDRGRGVMVLFGGFDEIHHLNDTWEYNGTDWRQVTTAHAPGPRRSHSMTYDERRGVVVLYGGYDESCFCYSNETWEFDGQDWTKRTPQHTPPGRWQQAMTYDVARGVSVIFGSSDPFSNDTWEYDGTDWRRVFTPISPWPQRAQASLSYDRNTLKAILFGGYDYGVLSDTWSYDGANWTALSIPQSPIPRRAHMTTFFPPTGKHVLFGGSDQNNLPTKYYNDTWTFDGTEWVQQFPGTSPPARHHFAMVYDNVREAIVMFGGRNPGLFNDTWEYRARPTNGTGVANAGPDRLAECVGPAGTPVTLDGSGSADPDGDPLQFHWSAPGVPFDHPETAIATGTFPLGSTIATLDVTDPSGLTSSDSAIVSVRDTKAPTGRITSPPASACIGPSALPVRVADDMTDRCDPGFTRSYMPAGGPSYFDHGDYSLQLQATDHSGNVGTASVFFTIDTVPPTVTLLPGPPLLKLPSTVPFAQFFAANDDDGASGAVLREVASWDGCTIFDGATYGNRDGLLTDELLTVDLPTFCEAIERCGLPEVGSSTSIRIDAYDCAGNAGSATRVLPLVPSLTPRACQVDLRLSSAGPGTRIDWVPAFRADSYDLIRGDVSRIKPTAGAAVDLGPVVCLARSSVDSTAQDSSIPEPGTAFFYLVRYRRVRTISEYGWSSEDENLAPTSGDCLR